MAGVIFYSITEYEAPTRRIEVIFKRRGSKLEPLIISVTGGEGIHMTALRLHAYELVKEVLAGKAYVNDIL